MSAKATAQPGRRTPLSLTGVSKQQQQPQQSQKTSSGLNEIQNNSKNDDKTVSLNQKTEKTPTDVKESLQKDKKQQNVEKKVQQISKIPTASIAAPNKKPERNEEKKTQNGVGSSNSNAKEKQASGKDAKINIKESKDKTEILDKDKADKVDNDKSEILEKDKSQSDKIEKLNENSDKKPAKKEEREKQKDSIKSTAIEKDKGKESDKEEKKQPEREVRSKRGSLEIIEKKNQEKQQDVFEHMDVIFGENKAASSSTEPKPATPVKQSQNSPSYKSTPSKATRSAAVVTPPVKPAITIIDDVEMKIVCVEEMTSTKLAKPVKKESIVAASQPTATSTPGKVLRRKETLTSEILPSTEIKSAPLIKCSLPDRNTCPRSFSQISGRRSIRAGTDYTTSCLENNAQYRGSYRRINTELDVSSTTNTSLNVTVGSEVPNNSSFSFFGRGRKRDRTPPYTQSTMDLQNDLEISPKSPKRARIDMYGFFTAVASPLSLLRARFSKASIQSSTPVKLRSNLAEAAEDDVEVQNVSGISIEEDIPNNEAVGDDVTATEEVTVENGDEGTQKKNFSSASNVNDVDDAAMEEAAIYEKYSMEKPAEGGIDEDSNDIKVTETVTVGGALGKNKRCNVM